MAHASCPSGHGMWNGDGKPVVWAFRIDFFRKFMEEHPDCIMDDNGEYWHLYDCVDEVPGEDLDCWYCDECKGLTVFVDNARYDFMPIEILPKIDMNDVLAWEEYIAMRECDFEKFQDYYEGMNPLVAIETYQFKYKYRVSSDKSLIYAINSNGEVEFGYRRTNYYEYSPELEITFNFEDDKFVYKPYEHYKGKFNLDVRVDRYAYLKDGRTIHIDEIIETGKRYKGRDINDKNLREVEIEHHEIASLADEICKNVIVE